MARATMDITFQCPGKNVRPSIKIFFFQKKRAIAILDQGLALHFSYRILDRHPHGGLMILPETNVRTFVEAITLHKNKNKI